MPEYNCGGYKCYLGKLKARTNACYYDSVNGATFDCAFPAKVGNVTTVSSQGVYISGLYCANSCNNNC